MTLPLAKKSHLLAKLYSASFLSWRDKCLSAGDFPKDLAAGCGRKQMHSITNTINQCDNINKLNYNFQHLIVSMQRIIPKKILGNMNFTCVHSIKMTQQHDESSYLYGGSRTRGIGAVPRRPECRCPGCFHLSFLFVLQQICYGGVNTVGFC